ncbi:MAG TPA: hypothetical protein VN496_05755, partial [Burkholderiales bacterium]|nr:hypothetical protein [Burkholderiales bacterium]
MMHDSRHDRWRILDYPLSDVDVPISQVSSAPLLWKMRHVTVHPWVLHALGRHGGTLGLIFRNA